MKHLHLTRLLAFALALTLLLGCAACGKDDADDTGETVGKKDTQTAVELDGKFTLNYSASAGMNPYKTQNTDNLAICGLVYEPLTQLTDAFEAEPGLFTEWSSDDGETWTFTVNTERAFHDGHKLTAQDAAYSIRTAMASSLYASRLSAVKEVKDNDDGTVTVTLSRANTQFPALLNIPVIENDAGDSAYPCGTGLYTYAADHQSLTVAADHPDADKAKKMFDDLKIVDYDGDGEREYMPDGSSPLDISLSLIVYADSTFKVSMANKIAADLTSIGIPVKVREMSWDNYQAALKGGRYDMYYGEVALPADFDLSALLKSGGALNYGGISTGTYADVINAYLAAPDTGRAAACRTMLQTISDTAPIVPICFEKHCLYVHRGAVGGFSPTKYNIFRNITDWKISQA